MKPGVQKPPLRPVAIDHRLLHRMQAPVLSEVLDRDQLRAIKHAEKLDAGIDRLIDEPALDEPADGDRAGAAVALPAAFFGTDEATP